jgi:malate/lactate dehydrogenase
VKLGIIGVGAVGAATAMAIALRARVRELVLIDKDRARARAVATDMGTQGSSRLQLYSAAWRPQLTTATVVHGAADPALLRDGRFRWARRWIAAE